MRKSNYLTHLFRMKEVSRIMLAIMFLFATNFTNRAMAQTPDEGVRVAFATTITIDESANNNTEEEDPYKEFVSPQWGLKCPEGYIRMTEYKELAKTDATAREQLDKLTSLMDKYKAKRQKMMKSAYKKITTRHPDVEAKAQKYANRLFKRAKIEMMDLGAYRLPDGTIVIEDDKSEKSYVKLPVEWQKGTDSDKGRPLNHAPVLERDKSPNYSAHNEQTWPVYTDVQTVSDEEYFQADGKPQVFRGEDCTYVVSYNGYLHYHHWFHPNSTNKLVDPETGTQYMVRYMEHFPSDTYYWVHNVTRKFIKRVSVYPPLPENVTVVDLIPGKIPADEKLSNSSPYEEYRGLKVQDLRQKGKVIY